MDVKRVGTLGGALFELESTSLSSVASAVPFHDLWEVLASTIDNEREVVAGNSDHERGGNWLESDFSRIESATYHLIKDMVNFQHKKRLLRAIRFAGPIMCLGLVWKVVGSGSTNELTFYKMLRRLLADERSKINFERVWRVIITSEEQQNATVQQQQPSVVQSVKGFGVTSRPFATPKRVPPSTSLSPVKGTSLIVCK